MKPGDRIQNQGLVLVHNADELSREIMPILVEVAAELGVKLVYSRWNRKLGSVTTSPAVLFVNGAKIIKTIPLHSIGSGDTLLADWRRTMGSKSQHGVVDRQKTARHEAVGRQDDYLLEGDVFVFDLDEPRPPEEDYQVIGQ